VRACVHACVCVSMCVRVLFSINVVFQERTANYYLVINQITHQNNSWFYVLYIVSDTVALPHDAWRI